jgi:hypothetical protein
MGYVNVLRVTFFLLGHLRCGCARNISYTVVPKRRATGQLVQSTALIIICEIGMSTRALQHSTAYCYLSDEIKKEEVGEA